MTERRSQESVIIIIALAGSEGTSIEQRTVRVGQGSIGTINVMSCSCRSSPVGKARCIWILDAINMDCVGSGSIFICQQRVRMDEARGMTVHKACSPQVRWDEIARGEKRLKGIVKIPIAA